MQKTQKSKSQSKPKTKLLSTTILKQTPPTDPLVGTCDYITDGRNCKSTPVYDLLGSRLCRRHLDRQRRRLRMFVENTQTPSSELEKTLFAAFKQLQLDEVTDSPEWETGMPPTTHIEDLVADATRVFTAQLTTINHHVDLISNEVSCLYSELELETQRCSADSKLASRDGWIARQGLRSISAQIQRLRVYTRDQDADA